MSPLDGARAEAGAAPGVPPEAVLTVDVEGFEGPLDMLLSLARAQKVDLRRISVLRLAEQYLAFVEGARRARIELAADYLVMAAWLAFLKSRLMLPAGEAEDEPSGEELAERLARRLERLDAMRRAAAELMARDRLGREVFARGETEAPAPRRTVAWRAGLADLLRAYARLGTRAEYRPLQVERPAVVAIEEAIERLRAMLGAAPDWASLAEVLPEAWLASPARRRSAVASAFAASLELARRGEVELAQEASFAPIRLRALARAAA